MTTDTYIIRTMNRDDLKHAVNWAAAEGWNPGLHDADCFYAADPDGFLVGELDGEPIACISVVSYGETFAFLGFYIVKPAFRGRGYGLRIWKAGLERLSGRCIGLDGVVDQQANYKKSGFDLAYRNIRFQGVTGGEPKENPMLCPLADLPFEQVTDYDRKFFPAERSSFLRAWIQQPDGEALALLPNGVLSGMGVIRPCREGFKIGPLFAETPEFTETLYGALVARVPPGQPVLLDVPESNPAAQALAERHRMKVVFETARMYAGRAPSIPLDGLFGVTSFELG
jgi:ribosomal protein S18 acetylase RimI-like enzyme